MPIYDSEAIWNGQFPQITSLSICVFTTDRQPSTAAIQVYQVVPSGTGVDEKIPYVMKLVSLNPIGEPSSSYTLDNVYAGVNVFGVRIETTGIGGSGVAFTVSVTRDHVHVEDYFLIGRL
ncbi:hypothetical protein [Paenibacillus sp. CF384]|uniref:hypothetical protein n=1 Tax=Paenibacillus sp. CF384 TaxID=1884382 RepID=UPI00089A0C4B|nr:hypothetical protein [Paenibacillus sp. CF384]SDX73813.1 hypothetical protein SAMN05518855_102012 [Paenibacillus sp. CF384]